MEHYKVKSPILFIIFNRPDTTTKVFEKIRAVKPKKIFIAADGARQNNVNDAKKCIEARSIQENIDWDCEVLTLYRTDNLGCKDAVSGAIDWFFQNVEEGIILEDDCLPSDDFFMFCDTMLQKYRDDSRINHIAGCNLQNGVKRGEASYFFSSLSHIWGWASWRRVWNNYDKNLTKYDIIGAKNAFESIFDNKIIANCWFEIFQKMKNNEINTWDYQFTIMNLFNHTMSIVPNINLISNIGFNENATHTFNVTDAYANIPLQNFDAQIIHPNFIIPNKTADDYKLNYEFNVEGIIKNKKKQNRTHKRIKKYVKNIFK